MKRRNQNRPLRFQAGCHKRRLNLAVVFCLFCVVVHFFWLVNTCLCFVRFCFSIPSKRLAWRASLNDLFCVKWNVKPERNQTIKHGCLRQNHLAIGFQTKVRFLYRSYAIPVLIYGRESWAVSKSLFTKLDYFNMWCLSKILIILSPVQRLGIPQDVSHYGTCQDTCGCSTLVI